MQRWSLSFTYLKTDVRRGKPRPAPQCTVLAPGEFNYMVVASLPVYAETFITTDATVSCNVAATSHHTVTRCTKTTHRCQTKTTHRRRAMTLWLKQR